MSCYMTNILDSSYNLIWFYTFFVQIKFVVDGDWRVDPEMELITRNDVHNNILRVE